jgi:hypothetical protein
MRALFTAAIAICLMTPPSAAQDGTASLTGKVEDVLGTGIADTLAELESRRTPVIIFQTVADAGGAYRFSTLPAGEYDLKLSRPGFNSLIVKSTLVLNGEHRTLPTLHLAAGANGDCRSGHVEPDAIRFLRSGASIGGFGGTVRLGEGLGESTLASGADVTLVCSTGKPCGASRTDSDGQFLFKALPPGYFSVRVTAAGFYPRDSPTYRVEQGVESAYTSIYVERCPLENCDPKLRPEKPPVVCE